ncbi:gamma-glutamyl-gamma-aminobutyrate hydrolase [Geothrix limicola]|uniref:Gamma-glutamyl-gamma-aminobutyrate hydrolase n=1 Tax=Geothrix limicola TaxID=2927978 RepID=A0ABQ5QIL4_9BACT|nr:gamma-glutamyl-gamma-aminobutyrate hydrolase family protein [Geothrix limicola]GLH74241.1 gamma-glutamyl-gamma-aminobutyrate hydrolase [Geothrix limicola]
MSSGNSKLLLSCKNKSGAEKHYLPALGMAGWTGPIHLVAPGDPLPDLAEVAGLLLTGGYDIHPCHWNGDEPLHPKAEVDADRDAFEIPLVRAAWERDLPILGICRGEQVLNVALGGSLIQDIPDHYGCEPTRHQHGTSDVPEMHHRVQLAPGSRLRSLLGEDVFLVNSRHHQAVKHVAPPLAAVGWHLDTTHTETGPIVEAIEAIDPRRWVFGVQWHPENLVTLKGPAGDAARDLFRAFIREAAGRP